MASLKHTLRMYTAIVTDAADFRHRIYIAESLLAVLVFLA